MIFRRLSIDSQDHNQNQHRNQNTMGNEDAKTHATSSTDFYELLGINFETSQRDLDRAWRRTALKYHPDKVGADPVAKEKFQLAQIGYDLLSDPASKAVYDNARTARLQRQRQNELFEGRRRQMKDDLEAREKGIKRPRDDQDSEEARLELELKRLAADGQRRRREREELLRRDIEQEKCERAEKIAKQEAEAMERRQRTSTVSEIDRTVKVRWPAEGQGREITRDTIQSLFSAFGPVESVELLSEKPVRLVKEKKKRVAITAMVTFESVVGAVAAVHDFGSKTEADWRFLDSVAWALKEPDFVANGHQNGEKPTLPKVSNGTQPNLEELTMIRLRKLEQKRLAAKA